MTAPEKIILDCKRWVDSNTGKFVNYSFEGEFRDADIYTTQDNVSYTRSDLYESAQDRIKQLEQLDSEAATHVESQIAMFERFTGEPPYVGWRGLGLALKEELEAKDERIKELETALNETADILNATGNPDLSSKLRAIAGGKDETTIHKLKTLPQYWDAVKEGSKTFEVRRNDRAFQTGDFLELIKLNEDGSGYDSFAKPILKKITYLLQGGQFGIEPQYCILGLGEVNETKPK